MMPCAHNLPNYICVNVDQFIRGLRILESCCCLLDHFDLCHKLCSTGEEFQLSGNIARPFMLARACNAIDCGLALVGTNRV
jgi:hypothetical protein